ncbi:SinI family autotransporter-associated protein [Escherichia albertii]
MQQETKRGLTKIALALVLAGYCAVPAALAAGEQQLGNLKSGASYTMSGSTGGINGTVPWITSSSTPQLDRASDTGKDHVIVSIDRGGRTVATDVDKQFHVNDKITINWTIGDQQGDVDNGASNAGAPNALTKATIVWTRSKNQNGSDAVEISGTTGQDSYTIQADDADYYIGIKILPTTSTGVPNQAEQVLNLVDLSDADGGGSDSDDISTGPVVDESVKVMIYGNAAPDVDLLSTGHTSDVLHTEHTYKVRIYQDKDGSNSWNTGDVDVTANYDYRWVFSGTSQQLGAAGGDSTVENADLVIPATNAAATTIFATAGADGVQGYGLSIKYKRNDNQ